MKKLLAVEGPDGGGKSTFLSTLIASDPYWEKFAVWHSGGPVQRAEDFRQRMAFVHSKEHLLIDRLPSISEPVYCRALGKPFLVPENEMLDLLLNEDPIVVYCRLNSPQEMLGYMLEGKPHKPSSYYDQLRREYPKIVDEYDLMIDRMVDAEFAVFRYNWKEPNPKIFSSCLKAMQRRDK